ncbi:hypothetical protein SDC9_181957 [bioreactor metagenome]|uniref:Uncharacterized protein n=1 Tax=bioreactor metagenome TaxID=1076179 RepID=A0A645HEE0_9ZZZZ
MTIIVAPIIIPFSCLIKCPFFNIIVMIKEKYIANPPKSGVGLLCTLLSSLGTSIAFIFIANLFIKGVKRNDKIAAITPKKSILSIFISPFNMIHLPQVNHHYLSIDLRVFL